MVLIVDIYPLVRNKILYWTGEDFREKYFIMVVVKVKVKHFRANGLAAITNLVKIRT